MHRPNLHDVFRLLAFEDTIASSTGHTSHIEELSPIDEVIVYSIVRPIQLLESETLVQTMV